MWLLVDVAGTVSVTELQREEDVGHMHLEGGGREGLSCVDTNDFALPPGVCVGVGVIPQLRSAGGRPEHQG